MPKWTRSALPMLAVAVCVTAFPRAGYGQEREGFWVGAGGGYGFVHASCDVCDHSGRETGGVLYVKAGWTLTPRLLLGGEFNTWRNDAMDIAPNVTAAPRMSTVSSTATFYPTATARLFVKGGVGVAFLDAPFTLGRVGIAPDIGIGSGLIAGAGYDVALTDRISLTPAVNVWFGRIGDLQFEGQTFVSDWKQNVVDLTIGLTFH